jgi:hypothetical protein
MVGLPKFGPEHQFNLRFRFSQVQFSLLGGRFCSWFWPWDIGSNLFKPNSVICCSKILRINNLLQKWERCGEIFHHESSHNLNPLRDAYIINVRMDIATINTSPTICRHLLHTFLCNISPYIPSCAIFCHFTTLTQIEGPAWSKPSSNLNLVVQQVQFLALPVVPLPFSSGSWFGKIPCRTRPNQTLATLLHGGTGRVNLCDFHSSWTRFD